MARQKYTRYDTTTGKIIGWFGCRPAIADAQLQAGDGKFAGHYEDDYFISVDQVIHSPITRPDNPATIDTTEIQGNGIAEATISNIPDPAYVLSTAGPSKVFVVGIGEYEITDGEFVFTIDTPGEYKIKLDSFPYKDMEFTINAS